MPEINDEFYVGYQPAAPAGIGQRVRLAVGLVLIIGLAVAGLLVLNQSPFADASFEFGVSKRYKGRLIEHPYPMLLANGTLYLLVGEGKYGAGPLVAGKDGQSIELEGTLIARGDMKALEVKPESVKVSGEAYPAPPAAVALGQVSLVGEIVDTKCYLGVMNPGAGKVHRACAARCLSGGIPAGLLVRDASGNAQTVLLAGVDGREIVALDLVGERVSASGELRRQGSTLVLVVPGKSGLRRE